jgi:DNA mismatch endonuclease (patch repair protein)
MAAIRGSNTKPELEVRRLLRELGYKGYRLHRKDLPGRPDIVFIGRRAAIIVNGCFWHGHHCKEGARRPKTNTEYWSTKIEGNKRRDEINHLRLKEGGWRTLIVWECELRDLGALKHRLSVFMGYPT